MGNIGVRLYINDNVFMDILYVLLESSQEYALCATTGDATEAQ